MADMLKQNPDDRKEVQRLLGQTDEIVRKAEIELKNYRTKTGNRDSQIETSPVQPVHSDDSRGVNVQPGPAVPGLPNVSDVQTPIATNKSYIAPLHAASEAGKEKPPLLSLNDALSLKREKRWYSKIRFPHEELLHNLKGTDHVNLLRLQRIHR